MDPIRLDDPCILFALNRERGPFCREFRPHLAVKSAPCWASFCGPSWLNVLVMETGIGAENVTRALNWLLAKPKIEGVPYEPQMIIFAGFAGALDDDLHLGDIVLATEIEDVEGNSWRTSWPLEAPHGRWTPTLNACRLLTMDQLITTEAEKRRLGMEHQAGAVDMESAVFANRCSQAGVPFGCVRAISDEVTTTLSPLLTSLLVGGNASTWRVVKALARHPSLLPELMRLARDTNRAADQLGVALGELLTLTLPWEL